MASIRPSGSPPPLPSSTPVETWAVRIAFGLMIVGMAGFVVYDLLDPGRAKASTESDEPTVDEVAPAPTTPERQPSRPSRFTKSSRGPAATPAHAEVNHDDSEAEEEEIATNTVAPSNPNEHSSRSFLGSPMGRMRPGGMGLRPTSNRPPPVRIESRPEPEPPPPAEPPPEPPPTEQPAETVEQPSEQPSEQPTEQPEQVEEPTDQPEQPEQPTDQPEQVEPVR